MKEKIRFIPATVPLMWIFDVDKDGILVNPANGMRVMGWQTQNIEGTDVLSTADDLTELYIPIGQKDPARQTGLVELSCNLNKNTLAIENPDDLREVMDRSWVVNKTIFDSAGNEHDLRVTYTRVPDQENQWLGTVEIDPMLGQEAVGVTVGGEGATNTFTVQFDNYGVLQSVTDGNGVVDEEGELNLDIAYTVVQSGPDEDGNLQRLDFTLKLGEIGNTRDSMTQYADTSTTKAFRQDGYVTVSVTWIRSESMMPDRLPASSPTETAAFWDKSHWQPLPIPKVWKRPATTPMSCRTTPAMR